MARAVTTNLAVTARVFETSPPRKKSEVSKNVVAQQTRTIQPIFKTGTVDAINTLSLGVAPNLPNSPTKRGGARNHAGRESHALSADAVASLIAAARHADFIGRPFNRAVCIHWEAIGMPLAAMTAATGHFLDRLTKWLARRGCTTAWLWVHENGPNKGGHCHLLAHIPAEHVKALTGAQKGWLRQITGHPYRSRVIHSKPIGGRLGLEGGNPDLHAVNLKAALAYVLKGACLEAASKLGLTRLEPGGRVIGKRCGTSQNIGAGARQQSAKFGC